MISGFKFIRLFFYRIINHKNSLIIAHIFLVQPLSRQDPILILFGDSEIIVGQKWHFGLFLYLSIFIWIFDKTKDFICLKYLFKILMWEWHHNLNILIQIAFDRLKGHKLWNNFNTKNFLIEISNKKKIRKASFKQILFYLYKNYCHILYIILICNQ